MKRKIIIVAVVIALVLTGLYFSGVVPELGMYGTGLNLNTDTQDSGRWRGVTGISSKELIDEDLFVTSWHSDGRSIKVVCQGSATYQHGYSGSGTSIGKYWYKVEMKDQKQDWTPIIWENNYDRDVVHFTSGDCYTKKFSGVPYGNPSADFGSLTSDMTLTGEAIAFYIKGSHVGGIRVNMMMYIRYYDWGYKIVNRQILHDEAYLASGAGSIEVLPDGKIDEKLVDGVKQYVFEEGSTVTFSIDTDYSGITQGGQYADEGWQLRLFNPDGNLVETWSIGDNKRDHRVSYQIPDNAYNPSGRNDWEIHLRNILFDQDEKDIFIIDTYEKMPGPATVKLDKTEYEKDQTVIVTVTAEANPKGTNNVYEFYCLAYYGTQRNDYAYGPQYIRAYLIGENEYQTTFSFPALKGDKWLSVEATAYDARHDIGGRAGLTGYYSAYVKDKNPVPDTYDLTVYVMAEGRYVAGATVTLGTGLTRETNTNGHCTFQSLPATVHIVKASYPSYIAGTTEVTLDSDKSVTITLYKTATGGIWSIVIAIAIVIIFAIIAWMLPASKRFPIYIRIVILAIGIVLALLIFLGIIPLGL